MGSRVERYGHVGVVEGKVVCDSATQSREGAVDESCVDGRERKVRGEGSDSIFAY